MGHQALEPRACHELLVEVEGIAVASEVSVSADALGRDGRFAARLLADFKPHGTRDPLVGRIPRGEA